MLTIDILNLFTTHGVTPTWAVFDPSLDPSTMTDQQLRDKSLPGRPPSGDDDAYTNWQELMAPRPLPLPKQPVQFPGGGGPPEPPDPKRPRIVSLSGIQQTRIANSTSSQNWSGGYIRRVGEHPIALVHGNWFVPHIPPGGPAKPRAWSIFVGLDGYSWNDSSLPQVGIGYGFDYGDLVDPPTPDPSGDVFGWFEWWFPARNHPYLGFLQQDFFTQPGFRILGSVDATDPLAVIFTLKSWDPADPNNLNGQSCMVSVKLDATNAIPALLKNGIWDTHPEWASPPRAEGLTAEWIVERPSLPGPGDYSTPRPLEPYGECFFFRCAAPHLVLQANGAIAGRRGNFADLELIRMNVWDEPQRPGRLVSEPDFVGRPLHLNRFKTTYRP